MITQYFDGVEIRFATESQYNTFLSLPAETQSTLVKEYESRDFLIKNK